MSTATKRAVFRALFAHFRAEGAGESEAISLILATGEGLRYAARCAGSFVVCEQGVKPHDLATFNEALLESSGWVGRQAISAAVLTCPHCGAKPSAPIGFSSHSTNMVHASLACHKCQADFPYK